MLDPSQVLQHASFPQSIKETAYKLLKIEIQGATNVAIQSIKAVLDWLKFSKLNTVSDITETALFYLEFLSNVRPNEPLAKNALKFIKYHLNTTSIQNVTQFKQIFTKLAKEYLDLIQYSKQQIIEKSLKHLQKANIIFTHCHSSTTESLIVNLNKHHDIKVVATETRPLYQGRITAKNLLKQGVDTIMIVDSACPRFITDDSVLPVDVVLIGADEITVYGDAINKVGSFGIALASYYAGKPIYVVTPSLKMFYKTLVTPPVIEQRDAKEVWPDAPKNLKIINPAFDFIPRTLISGFLTEFGLIKPDELEQKVTAEYPWIK